MRRRRELQGRRGGSVWAELWLGDAMVWLPAARSCGNVSVRLSCSVSRGRGGLEGRGRAVSHQQEDES